MVKSNHPFWGYRRVWAYLRYKCHDQVNKKSVYRIMRENDLLVKPNMKIKAKRTAMTQKPKAISPNDWWGIDMTKVMIDGFGWLYVVFVIDWYTKKILGYYAGVQCKSVHWMMALNQAVNQQCDQGTRQYSIKLMSDNGSQPTSVSFMKDCSLLDIKQAFTSYNNPKGNAETERFIRTFKEELVWPFDWASPTSFMDALAHWVDEYNHEYHHSSLNYQTPVQFENNYNKQHSLLVAA